MASGLNAATNTAAAASFNKIISYLRNLQQIGKGLPNTADNVPGAIDINNIVNTGLIKNQQFLISLCKLLRIRDIPTIQKQI